MPYRELYLKRKQILPTIKSLLPDAKVDVIKNVNNLNKAHQEFTYKINITGESEALLMVYYRADEKTTLTYKVGKNQDLSLKVAEEIKVNCQYENIENRKLFIKNIAEDDLQAIFSVLSESFEITCDGGTNMPNGLGIRYVLSHEDGGRIYVNRYTTQSCQFQGNSIIIKTAILEALSTLLGLGDVLEIQLKAFDLDIKPNEIENQLKAILPQSYNYLNDVLKAIISSSLILQTLKVNFLEYGCMVYPVLRGLEGYIKQLFLDNNVLVDGVFSNFIDVNNGTITVKPNQSQKINNPKINLAIEFAYSYYRDNRHDIFHVDGTIVATKTIDTKDEALEIMNEVFNVIEESYLISTN
jgi:hypothetical protein